MRWAILVVFVAGCGQAAAVGPVVPARAARTSAAMAKSLADQPVASLTHPRLGTGSITTGAAIDYANHPPQLSFSVSGAGDMSGSMTLPLRTVLNTGEKVYENTFRVGVTIDYITYRAILRPGQLQASVHSSGPATGSGGNPVLAGHSHPGAILFTQFTSPPSEFSWTDGTASVVVSP